jgi:predicted dehydrogenase
MKKVRLGIVGAGHWGPNLIRNFNENVESEVAWICDLDRARLDVIKGRYPGILTTTDWLQVVDSKDTDAVVVCTPTSTHHAIVKHALESGKHVFVEKPLTTSVSESEELVALASKRGLKLMVGHVFLFNPAVQFLKSALQNNLLGDLHYLYSVRTNLGPIRGDVNAWWDLGTHDVSILLFLLEHLPESVSARGASFINHPIEDVVFANFRFGSGVFANVQVSWLDPKKVRQTVLVGSRKMLVFDDISPQEPIKIFDKSVGSSLSAGVVNDNIQSFRKSIFEGQCEAPKLPPAEPLRNECQRFLDWILRDIPQPSDGKFGLEVVRVMEAATRSMRKNGVPETVSGSVSG